MCTKDEKLKYATIELGAGEHMDVSVAIRISRALAHMDAQVVQSVTHDAYYAYKDAADSLRKALHGGG